MARSHPDGTPGSAASPASRVPATAQRGHGHQRRRESGAGSFAPSPVIRMLDKRVRLRHMQSDDQLAKGRHVDGTPAWLRASIPDLLAETTMRAAVCRRFGHPFLLEDVTLAAPGPDDVTVRLGATSICHSDIIFADGGWGGDLPAVYGHEGAGVIEAVGSAVGDVAPGDHVIVTMVRSCGGCACCTRGLRGCCEHTFDRPGHVRITDRSGQPVVQGLKTAAFAERTTVHRSQIVRVDPDLPFDVAAVLACGVITGFGAVANSADIRQDSHVVVIGAGGVGLNCIQAARLRDARRIIAIDRAAGRLEAALAFGATDGIDAGKTDPAPLVRDLTDGRGADYVFVAVGAGAAIESALGLLAPGGMAVLVGMPETGVSVTVDPIAIANGSQRVVGSKLGDADIGRDIPALIDLYRQGLLKLDELITDRFRFEDINQAMLAAKSGAGLKTVLLFDRD
ncbi:MAG: zinc-binding dehydrogenase [Alphaproteobacteria bacterium]